MPSNSVGIPCGSCGASLDCVDVDPLSIYSLDGPKFGFVLECPPGENCGDTSVVNFVCCGQIIQVVFPNGITAEEKSAALDEAVQKCAIANLFCGGDLALPPPPSPPFPPTPTPPGPPIPPPPIPPPEKLYYSHSVRLTSSCPDGSVFHFYLKPGYFLTDSQTVSDFLAHQFAEKQIKNAKFCVTVPVMCTCTDTVTSFSIPIYGGTPPFSVGAVSGWVPDGMTVTITGRTIHINGTPATPGTFSFTLNISDTFFNFLTKVVTVHVINIGYSVPITLGFTAPAISSTATTAIASSNLKVGDALNFARLSSGIVVAELGTFTVTALDTPSPGQQTITNVSALPGLLFVAGDVACWDLDSPLPNLTVSTPYSFQIPAVGGSGSYTFTETGALPDGLTMDDTGLISGTPTSDDSKTFTVTVTDNAC